MEIPRESKNVIENGPSGFVSPQKKACMILKYIQTCREKEERVDLWLVREWALSNGGFVTKQIRQEVWPILADLDPRIRFPPLNLKTSKYGIEIQNQFDLIDRDVGRSVFCRCSSLWKKQNLNTSTNIDLILSQRKAKLDRLSHIIKSCIIPTHYTGGETYSYYQGFMDICAIFFVNLGESYTLSTAMLTKYSKTHFKDFLRSKNNFESLLNLLNLIFPPLLEKLDKELHEILCESHQFETDDSNSYDSDCIEPLMKGSMLLPYIITWFSHDVTYNTHGDEDLASRIFDFFIVSHPIMPFYFAMALLTHASTKKTIVDQYYNDENEVEDLDSVFVYSSYKRKIASIRLTQPQSTDVREDEVYVQDLIDRSIDIINIFPPSSLLTLCKEKLNEDSSTVIDHMKDLCSMGMLASPPTFAVKPFSNYHSHDNSSNKNNSCAKANHVETEGIYNKAETNLPKKKSKRYLLQRFKMKVDSMNKEEGTINRRDSQGQNFRKHSKSSTIAMKDGRSKNESRDNEYKAFLSSNSTCTKAKIASGHLTVKEFPSLFRPDQSNNKEKTNPTKKKTKKKRLIQLLRGKKIHLTVQVSLASVNTLYYHFMNILMMGMSQKKIAPRTRTDTCK